MSTSNDNRTPAQSNSETPKIEINLITGFLGSGKTTLINYLLGCSVLEKSLVLVNEFGQISIDDALIKNATDTVIEMRNGCVCCSLNDDLATTLNEIADKTSNGEFPRFRKLLLETTGLANAGPIIETILKDPLVNKHYSLGQVVTTVDGIHGNINMNIHAESVEQAVVADHLIITKSDKTGKQSLDALCSRLAKLNPSAKIQMSIKGKVDETELFSNRTHSEMLKSLNSEFDFRNRNREDERKTDESPPNDQATSLGYDKQRHDHNIRTFFLTSEKPVSRDALKKFWDELGKLAGNNLLRVKGIVNLDDCIGKPLVIQGVQDTLDDWEFLDEWPTDDHRTRIVFIGWLLDEKRIRELFSNCIPNSDSGENEE